MASNLGLLEGYENEDELEKQVLTTDTGHIGIRHGGVLLAYAKEL